MNPLHTRAAVSTALRPLWVGPRVVATVLAVFPRAVYLDVGVHAPRLAVVVTRDGVHQPGAVVLPVASSENPFAGVQAGQVAHIGDNQLALGAHLVCASRWWNPRPRIAAQTSAQLYALAEVIEHAMTGDTVGPRAHAETLVDAAREVASALADTASDHAADEAVRHALRLIGAGPGLTPAGDDILAGLIAGLQDLATTERASPALDRETAARRAAIAHAAAVAGERIASTAGDRTTFISAALLAHAARGEVARQVATMLANPCAATVAAVLHIGATSGADLCRGIMLAARTLAHVDMANELSNNRHPAAAERPSR